MPHIKMSEDSVVTGVAGFTYGQLQHTIAAIRDISFDDPSTKAIANYVVNNTPSYCLSPKSSRTYPRQYVFQSLSVIRRPTVTGAMVKAATKSSLPGVDDLTLRAICALLCRAETILATELRVSRIKQLPFTGDVWTGSTLIADKDDPENPLYKLSVVPSKDTLCRILYKYGFLTHSRNKVGEEGTKGQFHSVPVVSSWVRDSVLLASIEVYRAY